MKELDYLQIIVLRGEEAPTLKRDNLKFGVSRPGLSNSERRDEAFLLIHALINIEHGLVLMHDEYKYPFHRLDFTHQHAAVSSALYVLRHPEIFGSCDQYLVREAVKSRFHLTKGQWRRLHDFKLEGDDTDGVDRGERDISAEVDRNPLGYKKTDEEPPKLVIKPVLNPDGSPYRMETPESDSPLSSVASFELEDMEE